MPNIRPRARRRAPLAALVLGAGLGAAAASCAPAGSAPVPAPPVQQATTLVETASGASYEVRTTSDDRSIDADFAVPADRLWSALPLVYDSLGIRLTALHAAGRSLGAQNVRLRRRLAGQAISRSLTCGHGVTGEDNADTYEVAVSVTSGVVAGGEARATLRTWVQGTARPLGTSGNAVRCASTGWLERRIADLVASRLGV